MAKDAKKDMAELEKTVKLEKGEKLINVYSKVEMESLGGEGNFIPKGKRFFIHPNHIDHLEEKGFAKKIGEIKTEVPELDKQQEPIMISV